MTGTVREIACEFRWILMVNLLGTYCTYRISHGLFYCSWKIAMYIVYFLHTQIMGKCYSLHFVYFMQQTFLWCETDKGAILIFVYVLFHASSRTNARDRIRLLEDGLAREHCHHCHGNQPGGGGPGEYGLLVLPTWMPCSEWSGEWSYEYQQTDIWF